MNFSNLTFNAARGGGATPRGYDIRSSVDNFASSLATEDLPTQRPNWTRVDVDLSATAFDNLTSEVEFRFYVYAPETTNSLEFDDITLNGTVIPEPSSLVLLGLAALSMIVLHRRKAR